MKQLIFELQDVDLGLAHLTDNVPAEKIGWHFTPSLVDYFKIIFQHCFLDLRQSFGVDCSQSNQRLHTCALKKLHRPRHDLTSATSFGS
jgi:hypothetical protein